MLYYEDNSKDKDLLNLAENSANKNESVDSFDGSEDDENKTRVIDIDDSGLENIDYGESVDLDKITHTDKDQEYGADQIQILEGLEAVRKRPGMYIGTTSLRGLHHLVYEIVDNSVDEALAGFCTEINVTINQDNSITVIDNGRGIPVEKNKKKDISTVEVVFTILHAVSSEAEDIRYQVDFMV